MRLPTLNIAAHPENRADSADFGDSAPSAPERFLRLDSANLAGAIDRLRRTLGTRLLILAHHYQRDEIVQHADLVGDSLTLSVRAAEQARARGAQWIIFCGVHFMAETASVLVDDSAAVLLPNLGATCPMAAMADADDLTRAWDEISAVIAQDAAPLVPIAYVNTTAAVKSFVGERGGACCTSGNAQKVFEWALRRGDHDQRQSPAKILFVPDQHLGRNISARLGLRTETDEAAGAGPTEVAVWNPELPLGGLRADAIRAARVILWHGHCYVHSRFRRSYVDEAHAGGEHAMGKRAASDHTGNGHAAGHDPKPTRIIVHPECPLEVVALADEVGSTEHIVRTIEQAEPGSRWLVGTEAHLVWRLARQAARRGVEVHALGPMPRLCGAMLHIAPADVLWLLDNLARGRAVNRVTVPDHLRHGARTAIERMLAATQ